MLIQRGGSGGERSWEARFWLWPLPPPGALTFVAEWPLGGIALSRVEIDAAVLLDAAGTMCSDDRRGIFACLTPAGREAVGQAEPTQAEVLASTLPPRG